MSIEFLGTALDRILTLGNYRVILLNATGAVGDSLDAATILDWEPLQTAGGYQSFAYNYTPGTSVFDATLNREKAPDVVAIFNEAIGGTGYTYTHACLWQGRGAISNRPIASADPATNEISCTGHGLINGDRAFVRSTGTIPAGLEIQRYWAQVIDANTIRLHTNSTLTAVADFTDSGVGSLHLQHANGEKAGAAISVGTTLLTPGSSSAFIVSPRIR